MWLLLLLLLAEYPLALRARGYSARASRAHSQPLNINALRVNLVNIDIVDVMAVFFSQFL